MLLSLLKFKVNLNVLKGSPRLEVLTAARRGLRSVRTGVIERKAGEDTTEYMEEKVAPPEKASKQKKETAEDRIRREQKLKEKEWINRKVARVTPKNQQKLLEEVVTPLASVPYKKQLLIKYNRSKEILNNFYTELKRAGAEVIPDPRKLPCPMEAVYSSPITEEYRNKDEFCIYTGVDGNPKTVGFFIGSPASSAVCVTPDTLIVTRSIHKEVAKSFQNYIRQSPLHVCMNFQDGGHWRYLVVRSNQYGHVMASVIVHPQTMTPDELDEQKLKLKEYFSSGEGQSCKLTSLYFQACPHAICSQHISPFELLLGDSHIVEELHGIHYHISPGSFFPINTAGAAVLLQIVKGLCRPEGDMIVLDIGCGIGTSSLHMAPLVKELIGIDSQHEAVQEANLNAEANGITNARFIHGRPDSIIPEVLSSSYAPNIVAFLNPGRGGLGLPVIKALRGCKHLKKVIYITSKADGVAMNNYVQLCRPSSGANSYQFGLPFHPVIAVPVDLFPHTNHCELVMMFER